MSNIRLFRKEAVRHQFRSQEFGETVIEQPMLLDKAIIYLVAGVLVLGLAAAGIPLSITKSVELQPAKDNYQPVVVAYPAVIVRHLPPSGAAVAARQPVASVRSFSGSADGEITEVVRSPENGIYFPIREQGALVEPYQPIGYVLRDSPGNQYGFWLEQAQQKAPFVPGQPIRLEIGPNSIGARLVEVSEPYGDGRQMLVVELDAKQDKALLLPQTKVLIYRVEKGNVFELLSRKT